MRLLVGRWKVATLVAPAGWGKTTVAAEFAAREDAIWVTVAREERDPSRLLGAILAAGARLQPPFGRRTLARFAARRAFERDGGMLTASLLHELADESAPRLIVFDDAHELAGTRGTLAWLASFVERSPAQVRFLFAARGVAPFPAGRFAAMGERPLAREDLAFDRAEVQRLFSRWRVPASSRRALASRHQGWPAGLAMAVRATETAGEDHAWGVLAERMLSPLTPARRRDLLLASALDDLEPGALEAALGKPRARALRREIDRLGLFLDAGSSTPRFHPLFLDVLRDLAAREVPRRTREAVMVRVARIHEARGDHARALHLRAASGQGASAVRAFERLMGKLEVPEREPLGALAQRWLVTRTPESAADSPVIRHAAALADSDAGSLAAADETAQAAIVLWLARGAWVDAARSFWVIARVAFQTGRLGAAIRIGERLLPRSRRSKVAVAMIRSRLGALRLHAGDPEGARRDLDLALTVLRRDAPEHEAAEAEVHRATVEFTAGRWEAYLVRARRALDLYRRTGHWSRAFSLLTNMAEAYIYLGEEAVARGHLDDAERLLPKSGPGPRIAMIEMSRARAWSEEGRLAQAARAFRRARASARTSSSPMLDAMIDVWEGVLLRRRGRLAPAVKMLTRAEASFERLESPSWRNVARIERALVEGLGSDAAARSLSTLAACARLSRRLGDRKEEARARLFSARVAMQAGLPHEQALRSAVALIDRENYRVLLRKESDVSKPLMEDSSSRVPLGASRSATSRSLRVRITLLGGFAIEVEGVRRVISRAAARKLIALLALRRPRPQQREALAEQLWPGASASASRNRFDVALSEARKALEPHAGPRGPYTVIGSGQGLLWLDAGVELDLDRFLQLAHQAEREGSAASFARALEVWTGDLLPEWTEIDWAADHRERLRDRHLTMWLGVGRSALARREPLRAREASEQVLAVDPLHEEAFALLLRALSAAGESAAAGRAFEAFSSRSHEQLGLPPGPELVALARELGADRGASRSES